LQPEWPADKVERCAVAALIPYARNARTHSPEQVDQIAASIREWGWTVPVLVDEQGGIIAGHGRVLAAHKLAIADRGSPLNLIAASLLGKEVAPNQIPEAEHRGCSSRNYRNKFFWMKAGSIQPCSKLSDNHHNKKYQPRYC
jgi:ParB-like nuclease domain